VGCYGDIPAAFTEGSHSGNYISKLQGVENESANQQQR
jgi:hypothetical protein